MITPKQLRNAARFGQHLRPETLEGLADQVERLKKIDEVQVPDEPGRELAEKTRLLELKQLVTPMMEFKRREWLGLTDDEIWQAWLSPKDSAVDFARAIEAKLKEKNT
jgi:hypothetical protein